MLRVDADSPTPPYMAELGESMLVRVAAPILDQLGRELVDEPVVIILTDANGTVLARRGGNRELHRHLDKVLLAPGFTYGESQMGTNGIGTALESGRATLIEGREHFADSLGEFACAGAPIKHPMTGQLLGVLDITSLAERSNALLIAFAKLSAKRISQAMLDNASLLERALLEDYYLISQHSGRPVIALGDRVTMINEPARRSFTSADQVALLDHLRESGQGPVEHTAIADLPSGVTARLNSRPSFAAEQLAGMVIQIQPLPGSASTSSACRSPASRVLLPQAVGSSDVWQRAIRAVRGAARDREWAALIGEPGVGKATLVRAVSNHVTPEESLRIVSWYPDCLGSIGEELRAAIESGRNIFIPHIDELPPEALSEVSDQLMEIHDADEQDKPWVAVSLSHGNDAETHLPDEILPLFSRSVQVPPLRLHLDDLPELVVAIIDTLGCPSLSLSPDALRQLARLPWPGNVAQLRRTIMQVARDRRRGVVSVSDLPSECRSVTSRRLTALEALERDAIVRALATHGSKSAAAEALGMSRATIYRKIRLYGIT